MYVASPVSLPHGHEHCRLIAWLGAYTARHPEVSGSDNATIRLDLDNEPQPDAHLRYRTSTQNRRVGEYLEGRPELIVRVRDASFHARPVDRRGLALAQNTIAAVVKGHSPGRTSFRHRVHFSLDRVSSRAALVMPVRTTMTLRTRLNPVCARLPR